MSACQTTRDAYSGQAGVLHACTVPPSSAPPSELPFTGYDVGLAGGAAVLLVTLGVALRRTLR